jgi:hypothetical protein
MLKVKIILLNGLQLEHNFQEYVSVESLMNDWKRVGWIRRDGQVIPFESLAMISEFEEDADKQG